MIDYEGSLDKDELGAAVSVLAEIADRIDDALAAKHGGKTAVEPLGG
ncbi:MAG: hypothetical protein KGP10_05220 [Actinomycetales bacterium]|nr:hypothetical protein [Actinomycetales bacterium]